MADEDGYLFGMLTKGDIAEFLLETLEFAGEQEIPLFNLLNMLDGTLLNDPASDTVRFTGITIALPDQDTNQESFANALVICGSGESTLRRAAEQHAACIVTSRAHPCEELLGASGYSGHQYRPERLSCVPHGLSGSSGLQYLRRAGTCILPAG